jgi:peptide alpha-N-acetyltransferase
MFCHGCESGLFVSLGLGFNSFFHDFNLCWYGREESEEDNQDSETHGHVNSISVIRQYRRLGIAKKLMLLSRTSSFPPFPITHFDFYLLVFAHSSSLRTFKITPGFTYA